MNKKGLIVAGAIAVGVYLLSQGKSIFSAAAPQTAGQRTAQKAAQKVDTSRLPVERIRDMIAHAAALKKTREEVAALKAEMVRRVAAWKAAQKKIGQPITQAARIAALRKAAAQKKLRQEAAQKIGKKIGKTVAQNIAQKIKIRRAAMVRYASRLKPQIQRPKPNKKQVASWKAPYKFSNAKFRVITPSYLLKKLVKKNIARKKAVQQKKVQKTTPGTPSDRRKSRLKALYGSHWQDIWSKRQKR